MEDKFCIKKSCLLLVLGKESCPTARERNASEGKGTEKVAARRGEASA